jgi:c-di-GMP-binding flagellar brake protein YcgR
MPDKARDILSDAIDRNSAAVLSLPSAGLLRHHKSRLLSETEEGIWLESVPAERALIDELAAGGKPCGVSFKVGDQKVSFAAKVLRSEPEYRINASVLVYAVLVERPSEVKTMQRRNNYRVRVREDSELSIRIWRIPEHVRVKDKPQRAAELAIAVRDLSLGGIGLSILPKGDEPPKVLPGERVRVLLKYKSGEESIIEGRMRAPKQAPALAGAKVEAIHTGVQFQKLEAGLEGRQVLSELTKIVGELQQEEVRRQRIGIA